MTPDRKASSRKRVVVAGATGFVGRALVAALLPEHDVIALTRTPPANRAAQGETWRACDLFSLLDAERALAGADAAFYLVHSMMPSSRLTQGRFDDLDLICADNFARAASTSGVRHIVYLGGLLPALEEKRSRHLESRLEVERTLGARGVPLTTLRAGLVVGAGGSSFEILTRLVGRLPFMIGPRWTESRSQAIALTDVVTLLIFALAHPELAGSAYDIGCPEVLSYADTLRLTGSLLGKKTRVLTVPVRQAKLSLLWVSVITGAPRELVQPLLDSLRHDLVARDGLVLQKAAGLDATPLRAALETAIAAQRELDHARASTRRRAPAPAVPNVRSVQRLPLPLGRDARWVALEYARWLPRFMRPFVRVDIDEAGSLRFYFWPLATVLLVLTFAAERSSSDRQLFYITGGLLAQDTGKGERPRLEFRTVLGDTFVLAAIHDFVPRLPWVLYKFSQALVHLLVMKRFARHLARSPGGGASDRAGASSRLRHTKLYPHQKSP